MRTTILGVLILIFAALGPLIVERLMTAAPEWGWRAVSFSGIVIGILLILLSDPVYTRLWGEKYNRYLSTAIVAIAAAVMAAAIWFLVVTWPSVSRVTLTVDYQLLRPLPDALAPGEQFRILQLRDSGGLGDLRIDTGPLRYRDADSIPSRHPPYVVITNKGKDALQDIAVEFVAAFYGGPQLLPPVPGESQHRAVTTRRYTISIPILTPNERFEFVISNWSITYSVSVGFVETAKVRIQGDTHPEIVRVTRSQVSDIGGITAIRLGRRDSHDAMP